MLPGALLIGLLIALGAALAWRYRPAWRADVLALLALAGVLAVFFAPVLAGGMWLPRGGGDLASFLWPTYTFAARELRAGRLPLWNPHLYSGAPFIADNQSGVFYPPNLALFLLAPAITYEALQWLVIAHLWLAGAGMYLCLRVVLSPRQGGGWSSGVGSPTSPPKSPSPLHGEGDFQSLQLCDSPSPLVERGAGGEVKRGALPALFGAIAFMLSDVFVTHQGNLNLVAVAAYLPLVFLCAWQAVFPSPLFPLSHKGQGDFQADIRPPSPLVGEGPGMRGVLWALAAGALFGAATLAGHAQMTLFLALTVGAVGLAALLVRLRAGWRALARAAAQIIMLTALVGVIGAGIAAVALIPAAELTPYSLRASMGYEDAARFSLPPRALVGLVAPWVYGRGPDRFTGDWDRVEVGYAGAVALLLAIYGAWRARREPLARFWMAFGALALLMALGEHAPLHRLVYNLPLMNNLRAPARFVLLFDFALAGLAALGVQYLARRLSVGADKRRRLVTLTLVALLAVELVANGAGIEVDSTSPYAGYEHPAVVAWLRAQRGVFRIEGAAPQWQPDAAAYHGLYDVYGIHNPLALAAYEAFYWSVGQRGTPPYNALGARYVIRPKGDPPAADPFAANFVLAFDGDPALTVYENTGALPLALVVPRAASIARPEAAWDAIHAPDWNPAAVVYVEGGPPLNGDPLEGAGVGIVVYEANRLVYAVDTPGPAYLALAEAYYPGWRARVDGEPASVYRANTAFRAVYIDKPGAHMVELVFAPPSFALGAAISAATLLVLAGAMAAHWLRRRRSDPSA